MTKKTSNKGRPVRQNRPGWKHERYIENSAVKYRWIEVKT
jgi:hypothetical protein